MAGGKRIAMVGDVATQLLTASMALVHEGQQELNQQLETAARDSMEA